MSKASIAAFAAGMIGAGSIASIDISAYALTSPSDLRALPTSAQEIPLADISTQKEEQR